MDNILEKFFSDGSGVSSKYNVYAVPERTILKNQTLQSLLPNNKNYLLECYNKDVSVQYDRNQSSNNINPVAHQLNQISKRRTKKAEDGFEDLSRRLSGYGSYIMKTDPNRHVPKEFGPPQFDSEEFKKVASHDAPLRLHGVPFAMKVQMMEERLRNLNARHKLENEQIIEQISDGVIKQKQNQEFIQNFYQQVLENTMLYSQFYIDLYSNTQPKEVKKEVEKQKNKRKYLTKESGGYYVNPEDSSDIEFEEANPNLNRRKSSLVDEIEGQKRKKDEIQQQLFDMEEVNKKSINSIGKELEGFKGDVLEKMEIIQKRQEDNLKIFKQLLINKVNLEDSNVNPDILNLFQESRRNSLRVSSVKPTNTPNLQNLENVQRGSVKEGSLKLQPDNDIFVEQELTEEESKEKNSNYLISQIVFKVLHTKHQQVKDELKKALKKKSLNQEPKRNLRSYIFGIIWAQRIYKSRAETIKETRIQSLKLFSKMYSSFDEALGQWVFNSVRIPYLSILNHDNINLDIADEGWGNKSRDKVKDSFYNLKEKLTAIFEALIENTTEFRIGIQLRNYLKLIISNNSIIPLQFYVIFELGRINTENNELLQMSEAQQKMILSVYILVKVLIKRIMLDHHFTQSSLKTKNLRKNFKMICSVIYREILDYFSKHCKVLRLIYDKQNYDDLVIQNISSAFAFEKKIVDSSKKKFLKDFYSDSVKKAENNAKKKKQEFFEGLGFTDKSVLPHISKKLSQYHPDRDQNEIECIKSSLYEKMDLDTYYKFANESNFKVIDLIKTWLNKIYKIVIVNPKKE